MDLDPRQNSQIRRHLRRATQRLQAVIADPGGHNSSSSTDTWAAKAASIAAALGSVLVAQPPAAKASLAITTGTPVQAPHIAGPMFPPMPPMPAVPDNTFQPVPAHMAFTGPFAKAPPPLNVTGVMLAPPEVPKAKAAAPEPHPPPTEQAPPATGQVSHHAGSDSASAIAALHNSWDLDLRKCNQCGMWTYYRNGICVNKKCPMNQLLSCKIICYSS
jgi:hypothetical protein